MKSLTCRYCQEQCQSQEELVEHEMFWCLNNPTEQFWRERRLSSVMKIDSSIQIVNL